MGVPDDVQGTPGHRDDAPFQAARGHLQHIGNGMYGAVVIDPPGLAKVDHEYVLVSFELYLGTPGTRPR